MIAAELNAVAETAEVETASTDVSTELSLDGLTLDVSAMQSSGTSNPVDAAANERIQENGDWLALDEQLADVDAALGMHEADSFVEGTTESSAAVVRNELVFLDTSVEDYQTLLNDLWSNDDPSREIEVVLLSSNRDGVDQISDALANRSDLDAVHFVTHGTDRAVQLGSTWLTADQLFGYAGQVSGWGNSLDTNGDMLFYGCNLASSEDGLTLLKALQVLTGAVDLGNTFHGIVIANGSTNNLIGGAVAGQGNVISGNDINGIDIVGAATATNTVAGNIIGLNAAAHPIGVTRWLVLVLLRAQTTTSSA